MSTPQKSLYRQISDAVTDSALPAGFSLSRSAGDEKKLAWADGAPDDIILYHMSISSFGEAARGCMKKTVQSASDGNIDRADELYRSPGSPARGDSHRRDAVLHHGYVFYQSGRQTALPGAPFREAFSGLRDIIQGLLDEGPVQGISFIEDDVLLMMRFLKAVHA